MGKKRAESPELSTIWEIPDDVWPLIQTILDEHYPAKPKGHRRVDLRRVLNGIIFRLRTGCQWNQLPKRLGDDSTVHWHFQQWCQRGLLARIWAVLVESCDELGVLTGNGKPPTLPWAKPGWAAIWWAATPRTGAKRGETESPGRSGGRATGRHHCGGQCPRHQAAGRDPGSHCGGAPPADRRGVAASLPRQGL
jgi:transposase